MAFTQYVGNPDYRGFLSYLKQNGDSAAGEVLKYAGNDGRWSTENATNVNLTPYYALNGAYYAQYNDLISNPNNTTATSSASSQDAADEQAYWQDQMTEADRQLGRLNGQLDVANKNIDSSYQSGFDKLTGDKAVAERNYGTKKQQTIDDNVQNMSDIETGVRNRNTSLQRVLGSSGAGSSSAAQILAPYAAALTGSKQGSQVKKTFTRNLGTLETGWGDTQKAFEDSFNDLSTQRDNKRRETQAGFKQTEAGLLEQKANAAVQKAQAAGQSYIQARAARAPYQSRISELLGAIDQLGVVQGFTPKAVNTAAPNLDTYTYDRYGAPTPGSNVNPNLAGNVGAFWTLLKDKKEGATA